MMNTCRLFSFLAILLLTACATVPITGRTQLMLIDEENVRNASAVAFADLMSAANQKKVVLSKSESAEASRILDLVNRAGSRVIEAAGLKDRYNWEVVVVKSDIANAEVYANGKIVVHQRLIQIAENEGQIAAVIGHEVAHLIARHTAERLSQLMLAQTTLSAVDLALGNSKYRPLIGAALGLGIPYAVILPYSREHEYEADHLGLFYMAKAGYEPSEAIKLLDRMEKFEGRKSWDWLSTHPSDEKRRARLREWLPEAMVYFTDPSRPLPANLGEVQAAMASRAETSALAPEGLRPSYSPGFWARTKVNNRTTPATTTVKGTIPCVIGECLVFESDIGDTRLVSNDYGLVEERTPDGSTVRFNPPLRILQWPIKVGSSFSYMTTIETSQGIKTPTRVTASVVAYESVTVPAGTFMAFRTIVSLNGRRFMEAWWAPETRTGVRAIVTDPRQGEIVSELIDYQRSTDPAGAF